MGDVDNSTRRSCPICAALGMEVFFEMLEMPVLCNVLWRTHEAARQCRKGNIKLAFCRTCGWIGNVAFEPGQPEYNEAYEGSLHFSPYFQNYAGELATHLVNRYQLQGKDVIEIGCGKGEFLAMLCKLGANRGVGFDPTYVNGRVDANVGGGITFIREFYSERHAGYPCDLLCCRHTLEHVDDPAAFLLSIRRAIDDRQKTAVFFEVPNALFMLREMSIWDIIYEHRSYFSARALAWLFASCGFEVREVRESFAGQFLCIEARAGDGIVGFALGRQQEVEQLSDGVHNFAENCREKLKKWRSTLERIRRSGQKMVIWGAGAKGMNFLNTFRNEDVIEYAVDVNPYKQGKYIPGTGQKIVAPEFLRSYQPNAVLVMNSVYRGEIADRMESLGVEAELVLA